MIRENYFEVLSVLDKNQLAMPSLVTLQLNGFFCLFFLTVTVVFLGWNGL